MGGGKWRRTVSATINALKQLRKGFDRFNVILFDNNVDVLFKNGMVSSNEEIIHKAIQHINSIEAGEGTNIHQPLKEGINMIKDDIELLLQTDNERVNNFYLNQIIFITDGDIDKYNEKIYKYLHLKVVQD
mmetsp:Transcript_13783/g.12369  ORF Transcript_13783/g.12369 Transcript_13783/m.12369 type:complete len:131 (-) Transcript_13783:628-1020(-)